MKVASMLKACKWSPWIVEAPSSENMPKARSSLKLAEKTQVKVS